jgi:hypothetical protein
MIRKPKFILPAHPGEPERQLLKLGEAGAERALTADEIDTVIRLIKGGADLGIYDRDGRSTVFERLVHVAIQSDEVANLPQCKGQKLLEEIFRAAPDKARITQLINEGADLKQRDLYQRTALHFAVASGQVDIAERLIAKGADIDAQDRDGQTPLIAAIQHRNMDMIRLLLDNGARQDLCTTYGHTALIAALPGKLDDPNASLRMQIALLLVRNGADIKERIEGEKSALERLRDTGRHDAGAELEAAADEYRRTAKDRVRQDTPALKTLQQKKPGEKFKLKPRPPQ